MIDNRLIRAIKAMIDTLTEQTRCHVHVRYRVVSKTGTRYNLQAVSKSAGWPDIIPCTVQPGAAGYEADLVNGSIVLVVFVEGNLAMPRIVSFDEVGAPGFVPTHASLGGGGPPAARQGDTCKVMMPPAVLTGTLIDGGTPKPITGVVMFPSQYTLGQITTGSGKVGIG